MSHEEISTVLHRWSLAMFKALFRVCLHHSVKLADVIEIAKLAFVAVAEEELLRNKEAVNASRIAVMTGVHRKDVTRLMRARPLAPRSKDHIARLMTRWQTDRKFRTKAGKPRVLLAEGASSEFAELARLVSGGDISPYTILNEMERLGVVHRRGRFVALLWRDFAPRAGLAEGLSMLAEDTSDLIRAVTDNLDEARLGEIPNLHLKTEFTELPGEELPVIRKWLLEEGSRFHKRVREYLGGFDIKNPSRQSVPVRVAYCSFSVYQEQTRHG